MCRCAERRVILSEVVSGTLPASEALKLMTGTVTADAQDAASFLRSRIQQAKIRLGR